MSDATDTRSETGEGGISQVTGAVGRGVALLLLPLELLFGPIADLFNRFFGRYLGRMTGLQLLLLLLGIGFILAAPEWADSTMLRTLSLAGVWAIWAMAWDIQSGYTGYISFGHSVFSGAAGYTMVLLVEHVMPDASLFVLIPAALGATLVVGLLIALPTLRLRGPYFSLITFVAVLLASRLVGAFSGWTNGNQGLGIDPIFSFTEHVPRFYLAIVPMFLVAVVLTVIGRSNVGTILVAIRENESAVSAAGINPTKFKVWSFVLSSIPMAIGGIVLALTVGRVTPQDFLITDVSIEIIAMAVLGGMGSILGPLAGAFSFILLEDTIITEVGKLLPDALAPLMFLPPTPGKWMALWILVIAILVFAPRGLFRYLWHGLGRVGGDRE